jgi:uncharacterized delta-60 repeat protein
MLLSFGLATGLAFAAPGKLDPGFGTNGVVTTATAPGAGSDFQNGLVIQRNDKIVVAGESDMGPGAGDFQWRLVRYTPSGGLDGTFGARGTVTTSMSIAGGEDEHIWELALQPDGKIVAAGDARTSTGGFDFALARYTSEGTLDSGFGTGGKVTTAIGPSTSRDTAFTVLIDDNGKIVVAGFADVAGAGGRNFAVARYNSNGTLDTSFDADGVVVTAVAPGENRDAIQGIALDSTDKLVVGGQANMGTGAGGLNFAVARYNANGALDTLFDGDGIVTTTMAPGDNTEFGAELRIDANGKVVLGGSADLGAGAGSFDLAVARYNSDGSLDTSFDADGKVTTSAGPGDSDDDLEGLVIQSTGRILVGGSTSPTGITIDSDFAVARYNPNGSLDDSFGDGGIVTTPTAPGTNSDEIYDIALQSASKLVASGECDQVTTGRDVCVARYKVGEAD